jgi:sulfate permease
LVGAGLLNMKEGILWGGFFVALGALTLGGRTLETNATKITRLSLLSGSAVSLTSGSLVVLASLFGLPVPLTQATTMSIFGIGAAKDGARLWGNHVVKRIIKTWIVSPASSLVVSYALVKAFVFADPYIVVFLVAVIIVVLGMPVKFELNKAGVGRGK